MNRNIMKATLIQGIHSMKTEVKEILAWHRTARANRIPINTNRLDYLKVQINTLENELQGF